MKKFALLILGIILGALAMYFYTNGTEGEPKALAIIKPKGVITPAEARALGRAFNLKHKIINDSLFKGSKTGDNRSSWWAIEDIQNYINYAENQAGELGYIMNGLRVYVGAYPNANGETGLTTMFFIPTGYKNTAKGSMITIPQGVVDDIPGGDGLNKGQQGDPPGANYPQ